MPTIPVVVAAVFANRAEGGTNLVAMECMACGVPTILSRNTGHLDLIEDANCYPLTPRRAKAFLSERLRNGVQGWRQAGAAQGVEDIERVFAHREEVFADAPPPAPLR